MTGSVMWMTFPGTPDVVEVYTDAYDKVWHPKGWVAATPPTGTMFPDTEQMAEDARYVRLVDYTPGGGGGGLSVLTGTTPPSNTLGVNGQDYFESSPGPPPVANLYRKSGGVWGTPVNLVGPQGPQGIQGPPGTGGSGGGISVTQRPVYVKDQANPSRNAIMDGATHPLSSRFGSLASAQAAFPAVTSLTDEIDYWAIQVNLPTVPKLWLGNGTAMLHTALLTKAGGGQEIWGEGRQGTVLKLRANSNSNVISPADQTIGNPDMTLRGFSVDGNRANQSTTVGNTDGILLVRCDRLVVHDVAVHDMQGRGIHHHGLTGSTVNTQHWGLIIVRDNAHWGLHNSNGVRDVHYNDIKALHNGLRTDISKNGTGNGADSFTGGMLLDHSEATANGIHVLDNLGDGLWLRNLFAGNVQGVLALRNSRHGIRVLGFVNSYGGGWVSQGNGMDLAIPSQDIWFDGTSSLNYGVTSRSLIEGIVAGPDLAAAIATQGSWVGNETHGIWFDDGMRAGDATVRGKVYPGSAGDVRLPSPDAGTLDWVGYGVAGGTGNPTDITNPAVPAATVTDTSAKLTWTASQPVAPAKILQYTIVLQTLNGEDQAAPLPVMAVVSRADFVANGGVTLGSLVPGSTYVVGGFATDTAGNTSPDVVAFPFFTTADSQSPDQTDPTAPTNVAASLIAATEIDITHSPATDPPPNASGIKQHNYYLNGTLIDVGTGVSFAYTGLTPDTSYTISVTATDNAGNEGPASIPLVVKTTQAVVRRNYSSAFITAAGQTLAATIPADTQGQDLLTMVVSAPAGTTLNPPAGWSRAPGTTTLTAGTECAALFYRIAAGPAGSISTNAGNTPVVDVQTAGKATISMVCYSGINAPTPFDGNVTQRAAAGAESVHTFTPLTTSVNGIALAGFLAEKDAATNVTTMTPSPGWSSGSGIVATAGASQQLSYAAFNPALLAPGLHGQNVQFAADVATANAVTFLAALVPSGATVDNTPPADVTGNTVPTGAVKATQIGVAWTQSASTDTVRYRVYYAPGTTVDKTASFVEVQGRTTTAATITGLSALTQYAVGETAFDAAGNESRNLSNVVTPTTTAVPTGVNRLVVPSLNCKSTLNVASRNAANGWKSAAGDVLVNASGVMTNLGMTRIYSTGALKMYSDSMIAGGTGTNPYKRFEYCFKGGGDASWVIAGNADDNVIAFCNSLPAGAECALTWHHEPNGEFNTGGMSPANFKAAQIRISRLITGAAMPTGQPAKQTSRVLSLAAGVLVYTAPCFTLPRSGSDNHGLQVQAALPQAGELDANAKVVWDAYQNPPPGGPGDLGSGAQDNFTLASTIWGWWLGGGNVNVSGTPLHSYGYDAGSHGYCIGEWMAPYQQNFSTTNNAGVVTQHIARPTATDAAQAAAIKEYCDFLTSGLHSTVPSPYFLSFWENPNSVADAGATYRQNAGDAAKAAFTAFAAGPYARV